MYVLSVTANTVNLAVFPGITILSTISGKILHTDTTSSLPLCISRTQPTPLRLKFAACFEIISKLEELEIHSFNSEVVQFLTFILCTPQQKILLHLYLILE